MKHSTPMAKSNSAPRPPRAQKLNSKERDWDWKTGVLRGTQWKWKNGAWVYMGIAKKEGKDPYKHFPVWDAHKGQWIDCECGKPNCDTRFFNDDVTTLDDDTLSEENGWCAVFDQYCVVSDRTRSRCKICGRRACEYCSYRTARLKPFPRSRICHTCLKNCGEEDLVEEHLDDLSELFGYDTRDRVEPVKQLVLSKVEIL